MLIHIVLSLLFCHFSTEPMASECQVLFDGIDIKSKLYRKEIAPSYFFSYTPAELKNELKTQNLLWVEAQVSRLETYDYLNLNIHVYSAKATDSYGSIEPQSKLIIKTIHGKSVELLSRSKSNPVAADDQTSYIYPVSYELDKSKVKRLLSEEIDQVGIQWSSGYEQYTVYEVDFLMNQLRCLNQ